MKRSYLTDKAPAPIGPYSQAVRAGDILYISGQIPIIPSTGEIVSGSIEDETHQVLKNIGAILEAAGLTYENVVSSTVFIKDMGLFSRINAVYGSYYNSATPPARTTVEVSELPKSVNIEIATIAQF